MTFILQAAQPCKMERINGLCGLHGDRICFRSVHRSNVFTSLGCIQQIGEQIGEQDPRA